MASCQTVDQIVTSFEELINSDKPEVFLSASTQRLEIHRPNWFLGQLRTAECLNSANI